LGNPSLAQCERRYWGIIIFSEQITDRKRAEEALRESEAILRSFFDSPK